ncbi:hypothetical protein LguiB_031135 [Lonicera macranthoides]
MLILVVLSIFIQSRKINTGMWEVHHALILILERQWTNASVESDSQVTMQLLNNDQDENHLLAIMIMDCKAFVIQCSNPKDYASINNVPMCQQKKGEAERGSDTFKCEDRLTAWDY